MAVDQLFAQPKVLPTRSGIWQALAKAPKIPLAIIAAVVVTSLAADLLPLQSPYEVSLPNKLKPPFWVDGGSLAFPLGTDSVGRDILSRIVFGARVSMLVSVFALLLGAGAGTCLGLIAGYYGGRVDALLMRAADATMAFPIILFALLLAISLGPSLNNVVFAIGLVIWARYARVIRAEALSLRDTHFVAQAKIAGASAFWIIRHHLFPNVLATLLVIASLQVGWVITVEASLSFLGAGVPPPTPAWGSMIADGRQYTLSAWWITLFPGLAMLLVVLAFNLFGDWLRDALDPKLKQV